MAEAIAAVAATVGAAASTAAAAGSAFAAFVTTGDLAAAAAFADTAILGSTVTIGQVALGAAATAALGALGQALAPGLPDPQAVAYAYRSSTPERVSGYGRAKLSGAYMLYDVASDGTCVDVIALHDGLIDGFEAFDLNDDRVGGAPGWVIAIDRADGRYSSNNGGVSDKVAIDYRLGHATETAYSSIAGATLPGWSSAHRGDGIASMCCGYRTPKVTYYETIYPNGEPKPSAVARLRPIWDPRDGAQSRTDPSTWRWSQNPVLQLLHYLLLAEDGPQFDYAFRFAPTIADWKAAADDCDIPTPIKNVETQLTGKVAAHSASAGVFKVDGLEIGSTVYLGAGLGTMETFTCTGISGLSIGLSGPTANDHDADEIVQWSSNPSSPATEPRYTAGGTYKHTSSPGDVVKTLLASFDGFMTPRGDGAISIKSGRYYAPTVTIGPDDIVGDDIQHYVEDESAANVYAIKFCSPTHGFTMVEPEAWKDTGDILARGIEKPVDFSLPWVLSLAQSRRLAKRAAIRSVAELRGTLTTNLGGMKALGERYLTLQLPEISDLADCVIEVTGKMTIDLASMTLSIPFILADPAIDEWNAFEEEGAPVAGAQNADVASLPIAVITGASLDFQPVAAGVGGLRVVAHLASLGRDDVTAGLRWRLAGGGWTERTFSDIDATAAFDLTTDFLPVNQSVQLSVAYGVGDGRMTAWSSPVAISTDPNAKAPLPAPTGVSATGGATQGEVDFDLVTGAGGYLVAYSDTSGFDPLTQGGSVETILSPAIIYALPAGAYYAKVAAYDSWKQDISGLNFSSEVSFAITTGGGAAPPPGGSPSGPGAGGGTGLCVSPEMLILMADGSARPAGELQPGDVVRTRHETSGQLGDFEVAAVRLVDGVERHAWGGLVASPDHPVKFNGDFRPIHQLGSRPLDVGPVVAITVDEAHTYFARGPQPGTTWVLSHNKLVSADV